MNPEKVLNRFCWECKQTQALMFYTHGCYEILLPYIFEKSSTSIKKLSISIKNLCISIGKPNISIEMTQIAKQSFSKNVVF